MSDKEVRFGIGGTALWSDGDDDVLRRLRQRGFRCLRPPPAAVPLVNLFVGEVIFGGVRLRPLRHALHDRDRGLGRRPDGRAGRRSTSARRSRRARSSSPRSARCSPPTLVLALTACRRSLTAACESVFNPRRARLHRGALRVHVEANTNGSAFAGYGPTSFRAGSGTVALSPDASSR